MIESGVIKIGDKASESKCTLVYGQMNEPPGARARVALTGELHNNIRSSATSWSCMLSGCVGRQIASVKTIVHAALLGLAPSCIDAHPAVSWRITMRTSGLFNPLCRSHRGRVLP